MSEFQFTVDEVIQLERPVTFRMPFRYGVVTLTSAPEAYVAVRITTRDQKTHWGIAADLLAPKWFDKSPELTNQDNFEQLRRSIAIAASHYVDGRRYASAFGHHSAAESIHQDECAEQELPGLVAGFGLAQIDRAILDACCRAWGVSFAAAIAQNLPGITSDTAHDLTGFDLPSFFASLRPADTMTVRHTVGLTDVIEAQGKAADGPNDGLPQTLRENCEAYGLRAFKLKLSGDAAADIDRLSRIAGVLDDLPGGYFCTLDGNEQFQTPDAFAAFWENAKAQPQLGRLTNAVRIVEQPIARANALSVPLGQVGADIPCEIDESDGNMTAFFAAQALGYRGVSSKSCKGVYRSLLNRARVAKWNAEDPLGGFFLSAEDLSTQAGIALQQDVALANLIGCTHIERNGHQYGDGLEGAPQSWRSALLDQHGDLYRAGDGRVDLKIQKGQLSTRSINSSGYGTSLPLSLLLDAFETVQHVR